MDTDMVAELDGVEKADPAEIAKIALDGIAKGQLEVVADEFTRQIKAGLALGVEALYPQLAQA